MAGKAIACNINITYGCQFKSQLLLPIQHSAKVPTKVAGDGPSPWILEFMLETWKILASGFTLAQFALFWPFRKEISRWKVSCLYLSLFVNCTSLNK